MKKVLLIFGLLLVLAGCGKTSESDIVRKFDKSVKDTKGYHLKGKLEINRNDNKYTYDVDSSYKIGDLFKVSLKNTTNDHEQIILKNSDAVYVLTPNLNKSFKFKSEWPYNNSQIYLLQPLVTDLKSDKNKIFKETKNGYVFTTKVDYTNDKTLVKQKIYLDKDGKLVKVVVMDDNNNVVMKFNVIDLNMNASFSNNYFKLDNKYLTDTKSNKDNEKNKNDEKQEKTTSSITDESVYPMYVPADTYLSSQDVVKTDDGERVIMTFAGESPFTLVQENMNNTMVDYISGDPYLVLDTVGAITEDSVMWVSNNTEYYVTSDVMNIDELLTVAESINVKAVAK